MPMGLGRRERGPGAGEQLRVSALSACPSTVAALWLAPGFSGMWDALRAPLVEPLGTLTGSWLAVLEEPALPAAAGRNTTSQFQRITLQLDAKVVHSLACTHFLSTRV